MLDFFSRDSLHCEYMQFIPQDFQCFNREIILTFPVYSFYLRCNITKQQKSSPLPYADRFCIVNMMKPLLNY